MTIRLSAAALAVLAAFSASSSFADSQGEPVIVTATRTPRTESATLASVSVITREDIERQQARSVADVLADLPGVTVSTNGGPGTYTAVFLRGTESDHTLVLIDGVKVNSATAGTASLENIPVEQIERIELVRGPRSGLYGSEAIGGVIQIFTKKGGGALTPSLMLGAGSDHTYQASVGVSGGGDKAWFNASASYFDTDGFNSCNGRPFPNGAGCFTFESDDDGYRNSAGALRGGMRFDNGAELDLSWLRTKGDSHYDGDFQNQSKTVVESLGAKFSISPFAAWKMTLAGGHSTEDSNNYHDGDFSSRFDTTRDTFSFQNDLQLGTSQLLTLGYDYQHDAVGSSEDYAVTTRDNNGVFAQYLGNFGAHELQATLRADENEQFDHHNTGSVTWGYTFGPELRLFATYGTAFKAPTFNELYFPFFGNPDLKPEESRSVELGLAGTMPGLGRWSASVFQTHIDDLIAFDSNLFTANNIDSAKITGLEASFNARLAEWDVNTSLTLLDPKNESDGANNGNVLPRRAEQSLRIDADRAFGPWRMGGTWRLEGRRYDDIANERTMGGYGTVDLRGEYLVNKDVRVQASLVNLLDKDYETAAFYNQQGRAVFVTLRYQPK